MKFFELLQVALGYRTELSSTPTVEEWEDIYKECQRQAITGIAYYGIEHLPSKQRPPLTLAWTWSEDSRLIIEDNLQQAKRCSQLLRRLDKDNWNAVILKGQTHVSYYPEHLQKLRVSGDIDVWIYGNKNAKEYSIRKVIEYCQSLLPHRHLCYIHYDFPVFSDIPVEAHFRPSFLCRPIYNKHLQDWFRCREISNGKLSDFYCLTICLLHIYKHLFEEGIGLRQIVDYYFILQKTGKFTKSQTEILKSFGVFQFANDLEAIINEVLKGENEKSNLNNPRATFLLSEILKAGNFGQYDARIQHDGGATRHAWEKTLHNLRLLHYYPSEVLWELPFRLYHWAWRRLELWKKE